MTLSPTDVAAVAARHEEARTSRVQIRRTTLTYPDITIDDAYAIQRSWVAVQVAAGASVVGYKIGLTSRAMQQAMRIDEPDFGTLLDHMILPSGAQIRAADYLDPKLEVELAFVLRDDLDGSVADRDQVLRATERIVPALELIDARSARVDPVDGASRTVYDTISDNAANAGVIVGTGAVDPADVLGGTFDLRWVAAIMKRNGVVEETGVAAGVLDDPVLGVVWLARRLADFGVTLRAGQIVLAGSFTRPVDVRRGDRFDVDYGSLGVVEVSVT